MKIYVLTHQNLDRVALETGIDKSIIVAKYYKARANRSNGKSVFLFVRGNWEDELKEEPNRIITIEHR